jgi:hypothetical protein
MKDYRVRGRQAASAKHKEVLREVAIKRVEAGHRRVRAYALAGKDILTSSREQPDELLPSAQERGIDPAQVYWP